MANRSLGIFHDLGEQAVPGLQSRRVRVFVPGDDPGPRTVLVLFDGQNVFGDHGSYAGGWHAHDAVQRLGRKRSRVPVIVAIDHGGQHRIDELGPWSMRNQGGHADPLLDWLTGTLLPQLRGQFDLVAGPDGVVLGGSSMGGLAALYGHFRHPDVFGGAMAMSPSLWFAGRRAMTWMAAQERPAKSRIYLDCGGREGPRMLPNAELLVRWLRSRGWGADDLWWHPDPRGKHTEKAWRRRLPGALRFLFRRP